MPIYEYECVSCGERTELLQRLSDPPLTNCPACGDAVRKLLSAPAMQFKGSGWYVTDYAGKGKAKDAKAEAGDGKKAQADGAKESKKESVAAGKAPSAKAGSGGSE